MTTTVLATLSAVSGLVAYILWTVDVDRRSDRLRRKAGERAKAPEATADQSLP